MICFGPHGHYPACTDLMDFIAGINRVFNFESCIRFIVTSFIVSDIRSYVGSANFVRSSALGIVAGHIHSENGRYHCTIINLAKLV